MARDRKPDVQFQIDRLSRKHAVLAARIAELDRHLFLAPHEQLLVTALKKEKLAAKDALAMLKRGN